MLTKFVQVQEFSSYGFKCKGIFASMDIPVNTCIWYEDLTKDGPITVLSKSQILVHPAKETLIRLSYMLDDDCYESAPDPEIDTCWYFNHSCDGNAWYDGNKKIVACRPILKGEQVCYDYALTETESSFHYGLNCKCGADVCRGILTFSEWRSRAFRKKYGGHTTEFIRRKYLENGWYDPRIELRFKSSCDSDKGLFARENVVLNNDGQVIIKKGQILIIFAGKVLPRDQMWEKSPPGNDEAFSEVEYRYSLQIHKDFWQIPSFLDNNNNDSTLAAARIETGDYINHSCSPNCGMKDSVTVIAMRDIQSGEEITIDYAMINNGATSHGCDNFSCNCGARNCRGFITSNDYKLPNLQSSYCQYFSPFVKEAILKDSAAQNGTTTTLNSLLDNIPIKNGLFEP